MVVNTSASCYPPDCTGTTAKAVGLGCSQSESCLYFLLISSGVASSLMSRISYGLHDVSKGSSKRERKGISSDSEERGALELECLKYSLDLYLPLECRGLPVK